MLPMPKPKGNEYEKGWSEILRMCSSPSTSQGIIVELTRTTMAGIKKGTQGVARPFNSVDMYRRQEDRLRDLKNPKYSLQESYLTHDFFPFYYKDGKKNVSMYHSYISRFDFKVISTSKYKKIQPIQLQLSL